jgi:hypothetical protein
MARWGSRVAVADILQGIVAEALALLLIGLAGDEDLVLGVDQLETLADFQFLVRGAFGEALDVFAFALDFLVETQIVLLHLLDLAPLFHQRIYAVRPTQGNYGVAHHGEECDYVSKFGERGFHDTLGLEDNGNIAFRICFANFCT